MPRFATRRLLAAGALAGASLLAAATPHAAPAQSCFAELALTRSGTLGLPAHAELTPDGQSVLFLRSGPRNTTLGLYRYALADHRLTAIGGAPSDAPEHLSTEEKARRERARLSLSGITDFQIPQHGSTGIASRGGTLMRLDLSSNTLAPIPGDWIAPRLAPDGARLAAVHDDDLYVIDLASGKARQLTTGGTTDVTHGLADFAAAEEFERLDGAWWSPDSQTLLYEEADSREVEQHYVTNPEYPQAKPTVFRYPRAGTPNATLRLGLVSASGGPTRWVTWDAKTFPYLGRAVWRKDGRLFLVVLNRPQTREQLLSVDPATGQTHVLLTDQDEAWLNLTPIERAHGRQLPYALPDGRFLWAAQRGPHWQLELHKANGTLDKVLTPQNIPFVSLMDVDPVSGRAVFASDASRIDTTLMTVNLKDGTINPLVSSAGRHLAHFTDGLHTRFVDQANNADGTRATTVRNASGTVIATLPSVAAPLPVRPRIQLTKVGALGLDTLIIRPADFKKGKKYPVILSVYGGPGAKQVNDTPASYAADQCLADQGYIVVTMDGRGTPERDHDFERAIKNDFIDLPLKDQVDGLAALGKRYPELDMHRIGVYGWSFGGYFTAMATIRRPDVFKTGVAGAPPVDFADYDTAYTERYIGTPQDDEEGYRKSNVLTYADQLSRPLLILHGLTDDNVYFENTMKLTQALLKAGKPYDLMLLPGTHMLADPALRTRVDEARAAWFAKILHPGQ